MKRYASVRFGGALDCGARSAAAALLGSCGATATSWQMTGARTYALVDFDASEAARDGGDAASLERMVRERFPAARVDRPPLVVLRIRAVHPPLLLRIAEATGGSGRPAGIVDSFIDENALIIELDGRRTPLLVVLALIDVELGSAPGRVIEPLLPLDDRILADLTGHLLGLAAFDESHIIETHVAPLLAANFGAAAGSALLQ